MNSKSFKKIILPSLSLLLVILCLAALPSCRSSAEFGQPVSINVNYNLKNVKPFSDSPFEVKYEIIPLNVPKGERIRIFLNSIEVYKDRIFISTLNGSLVIYDTLGNHIHSIPKGEDISEISSLVDFMVNRDKEMVEVLERDRILEYDFMGRFRASNKLDGVMGVEYGVIGENRVFLRHKNSISNYTFTIMPNKREFELKTGQTLSNVLDPKHFYRYNDALYLTGYSNKVYSISAKDSLPRTIATVKNMNQDNSIKGLNSDKYYALAEQRREFAYINNFFVYPIEMWGFTLLVGEKGHKILMDLNSNKYYSHPLTNVPYSQNSRWVENGSEYYLFPASRLSDYAKSIVNYAPELYKVMERAPENSKMWIIKATYSRK